MKTSNRCPLCRVEAFSVVKNPVLSNVVQLVAEDFSIQQRSQNKKELEPVDSGGTIIRVPVGVYVGSYVDGKKDGHGKLIYQDGEIYVGSWKNDAREDKGVRVSANGTKYDGYWMNGRAHGTGKCLWIEGHEYEGDWQDGSQHGYGVFKKQMEKFIRATGKMEKKKEVEFWLCLMEINMKESG